MPKEIEVIMPYEPPTEVAQWMSNLGFGFSSGERIADGVKNYRRIRAILFNEQRIERERIAERVRAERDFVERAVEVLQAQNARTSDCSHMALCLKGAHECACAAMGL
jgi:hypothetical protein